MSALTSIEPVLDCRGIPYTHRKTCGGLDMLTFEVNGHIATAVDEGDEISLRLTLDPHQTVNLLEEVMP